MRPLLPAVLAMGLALSPARAQAPETSPLPDRNPMRVATVVPPKPVLPGEEPTIPWTNEELNAAKAACKELLKSEVIDYEELPSSKQGACGAPAPILVRSLGNNPKVTIDPPATMTCPMAKELSDWLEENVQPEAKKYLNSEVVGLHNATSYACRNRYGSATAPLSEHALANALDVSEFVFASGKRVTVLDAWPKKIATPLPSAHAVQPEDEAKNDKTDKTEAKHDGDAATVTKTKAAPEARPLPPKEAKEPGHAPSPETAEPDKPTPESQFVKAVHDEACKDFGTVLGPEANEAHKNHFHLDMKARKHSSFCQ